MWNEIDNKLIKEYSFPDFITAFRFLTAVAILAEKHNHHPLIWNVFNKVRLELTTHDAGNVVTVKDRTLADAIDKLG